MWLLYLGLPLLGLLFGGPVWAIIMLVVALLIGLLAKK